jgi:predicted phage tail protein
MKLMIKGSGGGGKGGGGDARTPVESPDSLRSIQYANVLDLVSEGEIRGLVDGLKSIYLDDTPLQNPDGTYNFTGITVNARNGTQSQSYIPGFAASESELPVVTEVKNATPVTRSISNTNDTAVRVTVSVPALSLQNLTNGDLGGTSVEYAIDIQNDGGGFVAQPLRSLFQSGYLALSSGGAVSAIESTKFQIVVGWTGQNIQAPQTCTFQLQYRVVGDVSWLPYQSYTFQGGAVSTGGIASIGILGGVSTTYPSGSKTFDLTLPEDEYEFRVVKTTGSVQNASASSIFIIPTAPSIGLAYGGSVSITGGSVYGPAYTDIITGKTTSKYQRSKRIELPAGGPWDIRVRRITADSVQSNLQNKLFFDSITEIIDAKLTYPNSALVGLSIDAKQFNNIPTRGYEIYGMLVKVPSNYDPLTREYTGTWDGTFNVAWSDNPAWVFYDIVTNARYGLGEFIDESQVDKWGLYTIAQYCDVMVEDGFGGIEPRFTCNLYLQTRQEAYTVVANLASIFRAITFWGTGEVRVSQDSPKDSEQLFTKANVIDGQFSYSGSSGSVRHSVVLVSWNDPQDAYRQKIEYVDDDAAIARYGVIQTEIVAMGCTSRGQAARVGRWMIYSEQNETETITFRAGMDSVFVSAGSVITTQDPNRAGARMGGRLITGTLNSIELDAPVEIGASTYIVSVVMPDGTIKDRTVTNAPGTTSTLTVTPDFPDVPQNYAIWILAAEDLVPEQWRVVSIAEIEKTQFEITALAYRPDKYAAIEQDLILEPLPTSNVNASQPATPSNLNVVESLYLVGLSVVGVTATVSWDYVSTASSYILIYQRENQNPVTIDNIRTNSIDIKPIVEGDYSFSVYAVNGLGRRSQGNQLAVTIYGKTTPPVDVTNFSIIKSSGLAVASWALHPDLDVQVGGNIVVRHSSMSEFATWQDGVILDAFAGNSVSGLLPLITGTYMAKALDSSGNWSPEMISFVATEGLVTGFNTVATITESPDFSGDKTYTTTFDGVLQLASVETIGSMPGLVSTWPKLSSLGGVSIAGTYEFEEMVDLGTVATRRFETTLTAQSFDTQDLISYRGLVSQWGSVSGDVINDCDATLYISTTDDDPLASPTWGDYTPFFVADFTCRAARFRLDLMSAINTHNIRISNLVVKAKEPV